MLRGYRKTALLAPGEAADLTFGLTTRGLSTWVGGDTGELGESQWLTFRNGGSDRGRWRPATGRFVALVGSSSRNASLSHEFEVETAT